MSRTIVEDELKTPLLPSDEETELKKLFFKACKTFWINDDREFLMRAYNALFIFLEAKEKNEVWTKCKDIQDLIHDTINKIPDKEIMENLIKRFKEKKC